MKSFWYGFCSIMQTRLYFPPLSSDEMYELGTIVAMLFTVIVGVGTTSFCLLTLMAMFLGEL